MKLLYLLVCVSYVSCFYTNIQPSNKEKITGGTNSRVSYHAALYYLQDYICGAVILSKDWLLTAEICVADLDNIHKNLKARTGTVHRNFGVFSDVSLVEKYSDSDPAIDVEISLALVLLAVSIELNRLQNRVALATTSDDPEPNALMIISGYGELNNTSIDYADILQATGVRVLHFSECYRSDSEELFCAWAPNKDACFGDVGGPGVIDEELVAIITGEPKCGSPGLPTAYSKVGYFYTWIWQETSHP